MRGGENDHTAPPAKRRSLRALNTLLRLLGVTLFCLAAPILLFEIIYRYQLIDTYRSELRAFNTAADLAAPGGRDTILVMGDSFTAGVASYPSMIRAGAPRYRVINSGITGTGILEAALIAPRRFRQFEPSIFVYQVFVGNDLFNIRYPIAWGRVSAARNLYWVFAQRLRGLGFLNYRAGQNLAAWRQSQSGPSGEIDSTVPFSPEIYDPQERSYLTADPYFLENQVLARGDREEDYREFLVRLDELLSHCRAPECTAYILVIPHSVQVDRHYLENLRRCGARFRDPELVLSEEYPFLTGIEEHLRARGLESVRVLDLMGALRRSEAMGQPVYYAIDPHLNKHGQRIVAEFVLDEIER